MSVLCVYIFLFDPFQRLGQKLWKFSRDFFGEIEAKKNCFWDFLIFIEHQRKNIFRYFLSDMDIEMLLLHFKSGFFLLQVCPHDSLKMASVFMIFIFFHDLLGRYLR